MGAEMATLDKLAVTQQEKNIKSTSTVTPNNRVSSRVSSAVGLSGTINSIMSATNNISRQMYNNANTERAEEQKLNTDMAKRIALSNGVKLSEQTNKLKLAVTNGEISRTDAVKQLSDYNIGNMMTAKDGLSEEAKDVYDSLYTNGSIKMVNSTATSWMMEQHEIDQKTAIKNSENIIDTMGSDLTSLGMQTTKEILEKEGLPSEWVDNRAAATDTKSWIQNRNDNTKQWMTDENGEANLVKQFYHKFAHHDKDGKLVYDTDVVDIQKGISTTLEQYRSDKAAYANAQTVGANKTVTALMGQLGVPNTIGSTPDSRNAYIKKNNLPVTPAQALKMQTDDSNYYVNHKDIYLQSLSTDPRKNNLTGKLRSLTTEDKKKVINNHASIIFNMDNEKFGQAVDGLVQSGNYEILSEIGTTLAKEITGTNTARAYELVKGGRGNIYSKSGVLATVTNGMSNNEKMSFNAKLAILSSDAAQGLENTTLTQEIAQAIDNSFVAGTSAKLLNEFEKNEAYTAAIKGASNLPIEYQRDIRNIANGLMMASRGDLINIAIAGYNNKFTQAGDAKIELNSSEVDKITNVEQFDMGTMSPKLAATVEFNSPELSENVFEAIKDGQYTMQENKNGVEGDKYLTVKDSDGNTILSDYKINILKVATDKRDLQQSLILAKNKIAIKKYSPQYAIGNDMANNNIDKYMKGYKASPFVSLRVDPKLNLVVRNVLEGKEDTVQNLSAVIRANILNIEKNKNKEGNSTVQNTDLETANIVAIKTEETLKAVTIINAEEKGVTLPKNFKEYNGIELINIAKEVEDKK